VKICPCCHASVRRKTRYNKTRQDQYRKICLKPLEDNTILGMRACKRCGTKFPRTLHTGNRKFCGGCKK
tara:strand:+ start:6652 stop:6858 length:207 start_codon:yes stop_codon:yes gene_type:complete